MAVSATPQIPERAPISFGAWLGIVLLFLFFGIFVLVLVAATPHGDNYEAKRAQAREEKLKTTRDTANKELNAYAWVDKAKGVTRIPIDRAMQPSAAGASGTPKPTSVQGINSENRGQPAAASNPPGAIPGTQPGPGATPAASPPPPSGQPAVSPSPMPEQKPSGTPSPEKTPA